MSKTELHADSPAMAASRPDATLFREGMSRVAAAVHIVATDGPAGRAGFTATAVTPVTDSPATLLVCVNTAGRSTQALLANQVFSVNTLGAGEAALADIFAGRTDLHGKDRFTIGQWSRCATGAPLLTTSLVSFDCRLVDARVVATHHVLIGEIADIRLGESGPALVYQGRLYRNL